MSARIAAVEYYLPEMGITDQALHDEFPDWNVGKISAKTGIRTRRLAGQTEFTSDLCVQAGKKLFIQHGLSPSSVDYLIVCTQSPDFFMPTTACLVQDALGIPTDSGALDVRLGCSGYVYSLGLAKGLIQTGQARSVLVITAETHTKLANPADKSTRPIFGDGAAATLVVDHDTDSLHSFVYGTDGIGGKHLVVPNGGMRRASDGYSPRSSPQDRGLNSNGYDMYMDGAEIFNFTLRVVPGCVDEILEKANLNFDEVDLFVFHQANRFLIEHLRKKLGIPAEKFVHALENYGNTGSSTIPIALADAESAGQLRPGMKVLIVGFGVGLSWGGAILEW
jgi:3-oxoacyl-[acyl-carrier-protein] synthase-3